MKQQYPRLLLLLLAFFTVSTAITQAQCPITASCTPGRASNPQAAAFGMGIFNVTIGSINNTSAGQADGYQDYSCTQSTPLTVGQTYPVSITTNASVNETVRVWIDFDNNGQFHPTNELFFSSDNARQHTGTSLAVPATAVVGGRLRLRVSADAAISPVPTPCSTPQYSQVEDYGVTIQSNTQRPTTAFAVTAGTTCGAYRFQDQSTGAPASWRWTFGDGSFSTQQNPTHAYTTPGSYAVRLRTCNAVGCDSLLKPAVATIFTNYPAPASCQPATLSYCCNYGITRVDFGMLSNASANGSAGYEDFSCTRRVTVAQGQYVPLQITTSSTRQNTWVYLDGNNDGAFTASELLFQSLNSVNPQGFIVVPRTTMLDQALRLRIISDALGTVSSPCADRTSGQVEDYSVVVTPVPCPTTLRGGRVDFFYSAAEHLVPDSVTKVLMLTQYTPGATVQWQRSAYVSPPVWQSLTGATSPVLMYKQVTQRTDSLYRAVVSCGTSTVPSTNSVLTYPVSRPAYHYTACTGANSPYIQRVRLAGTTLNSASGCSGGRYGQEEGYHLFNPLWPANTATVRRGETYVLEVTTARPCRISIFVGSQDQDLLPIQRLYATAAGVPTRLLLTLDSLQLPATVGAVQLRIRTDVDVPVNAPFRNSYIGDGETEDYLLRMVPYTCAEPLPGAFLTAPTAMQCARDSFRLAVEGHTPGTHLVWQRSADSLTWQPIAGANRLTLTTLITTNTYFRALLLGCTTTLATPAVLMRARPVAECYCSAPVGAVPANAPTITQVKIVGTTLDNASAATAGGPGAVVYTPTQPNRTAELVRGATYTLQLRIANAGASPGALLNATAWLDLNRNAQFDSVEWIQLLRTPATANGATTYQATLPVGVWATPGTMGLRLRVGNDVGFRPSAPCAPAALPAGQGETETYTVTVIAPPCQGTLTAGVIDAQYNVSGVCRSRLRSTSYTPGASLQWQEGASRNGPWTDIPGETGDEYVAWSYIVGNFRLRAECGGTTAYSPDIQLYSPNAPACGCAVNTPSGDLPSNNRLHAYVDEVELVGTPLVNVGSGINFWLHPRSTYRESTGRWAPQTQGFTATLVRGSSYPLRLVAVGSVSSATPTGTAVGAWIDWNHNGSFESSEYYGTPTNGLGRVGYTTAVTVPATAALGLTLMRVRAASNLQSPAGCQFYQDSETEEYLITVADQPALAVPVLTAAPTPLCLGSTLQLGASGAGPGTSYSWLGPAGFVATNTATPTRAGIAATHGGTYITIATRNGERLLTSVYVPIDTCHTVLVTRPALAANRLTVFPNPTTGSCTVQLPAALLRLTAIAVRNMTGQLMAVPAPTMRPSADGTEVTLDMHALPPGLYLLEVDTGQGHLFGKVARQ